MRAGARWALRRVGWWLILALVAVARLRCRLFGHAERVEHSYAASGYLDLPDPSGGRIRVFERSTFTVHDCRRCGTVFDTHEAIHERAEERVAAPRLGSLARW